MIAPVSNIAPQLPEGRLFADLSTDELRARAKQTDNGRANWDQWTREMLLAFFHNRFGRYVP